ncbi:hypothetical protein QQF64_025201 [Cirrhinus molitorella]|uniref:Uncharacterized protein n=1 Tax=Cirrhinus molitorella TaxID=172907 RepID=A0ABR3NPB5_9TELE
MSRMFFFHKGFVAWFGDATGTSERLHTVLRPERGPSVYSHSDRARLIPDAHTQSHTHPADSVDWRCPHWESVYNKTQVSSYSTSVNTAAS